MCPIVFILGGAVVVFLVWAGIKLFSKPATQAEDNPNSSMASHPGAQEFRGATAASVRGKLTLVEEKKCKACGAVVIGSHDCFVAGRTVEYDDSSFLTSLVVAAATGSGLLGYAAGGSIAGAVVGSALVEDAGKGPEPEPAPARHIDLVGGSHDEGISVPDLDQSNASEDDRSEPAEPEDSHEETEVEDFSGRSVERSDTGSSYDSGSSDSGSSSSNDN